MKKTISLLVFVISLLSCENKDNSNNDIDVKSKIENIINTENMNVYISKEIVKPSTNIATLFGAITSPDYESWFVFIDEYPFANWVHPCKYLFIHPETGEYTILDENSPPNNMHEMNVIKEVQVEEGGDLFNFDNVESTRSTTDTNNLWAVIISGGGNMYNNHIRYWNDCSAMYNVLTKKYGYRRDHIIVIMADGTNPASDRRLINGTYDSSPLDLDNDGIADIQYAATRSNLQTVFNNLANRLTSNDELFIFTTDHGGRVGNNSTLVLWNNEVIYDNEFASLVYGINARHYHLVMEQCYSGGFINYFKKPTTVIATACKENELSYARSNLLYNEFVYHWISAAYGKTVDGEATISSDLNNDGVLTTNECFKYAESNDVRSETPQFNSTSGKYQYKLALNGIQEVSECKFRVSRVSVYEEYVTVIFETDVLATSDLDILLSVRGELMWNTDRDNKRFQFENERNKITLNAGKKFWGVDIIIKEEDIIDPLPAPGNIHHITLVNHGVVLLTDGDLNYYYRSTDTSGVSYFPYN